MTKQEEIKNYIEQKIEMVKHQEKVKMPVTADGITDFILHYLHSQGVVIKVDSGWCPAHGYPLPCDKCGAPVGTWSVEPLIEVEK